MSKTYIVKKGDNLFKISKNNNIPIDELIKLNSIKNINLIYPDDVLRLEPDKIVKDINIREERQIEDNLNLENIKAIQGYHHDSNYVVVDKKKQTAYCLR